MSNLDILASGFFALVATAGFAILFDVPRWALPATSLIGGLGYMIRSILMRWGASAELATFCAALIMGLTGYVAARRYHSPRLMFTVPGTIPMIPGIFAFEVIVQFSTGDIAAGIVSAVRAMLLAGAIAAGLVAARILTELEWTSPSER